MAAGGSQHRDRDAGTRPSGSVDERSPASSALRMIHRVTAAIASAGDLQEILDGIVQGTVRLLGATRGSLLLLEPGSRILRIGASVGLPDPVRHSARPRLGEGIAGRCAESGEPIWIRNQQDLRAWRPGQTPRPHYRRPSALCVPLTIRGEVLGVLNVNDRADGRDFDEEDLVLACVTANQAALALWNARLLDEAARAGAARRALELAREIQQAFIPPPAAFGANRVAALSWPCEGAGGDYVDFWPDPDGRRLHLAIGDVSGHGVGAALIMATLRSSLRALAPRLADPAAALDAQNRLLCADLREGRFMTLFVGRLDLADGRLRYASAGHDPAILLGSDGCLRELAATGPPLGVTEEAAFELGEACLAPGARLALTTDGTWEVKGNDGGFFGRERLGRLVAGPDDSDTDPETLARRIAETVAKHAAPRPLPDDLSLVVVQRGRGD